MIDVVVCRNGSNDTGCFNDDPDLNWGDDIVDQLLTTVEAARERGRVAIDESFSNRKKVVITVDELEFIQPGELQTIDEGFYVNGLLRSLNIQYRINEDKITAKSSLVIERTV